MLAMLIFTVLPIPRVCRDHTRRCLRCPPGDKMPPWLSSTPFAAALLGTGLGFTIQSQLLSQKSPPSQSATQTSASSSRIRRRAPSAWRRPLPIPEFTLVIGAVCDERRHDFRRRLRQLYGPHVAKREMLIKFVVSERYRSDERWLARERARGLPHSAPANDGSATDSAAVDGRVSRRRRLQALDDLLFMPAAHRATGLERVDCPGQRKGSRRCFSQLTPYHEAHCAHKTMGWWRVAGQWPARWYGKTDDDAVIDVPPLLRLLSDALAPISGPVFAGIVRYSSVNMTNLEGVCFASGATYAIRYRRKYCAGPRFAGPFPYVEGPLEILSPDVQSFLSQRARMDPRQRCHYEDLYVGMLIAQHPQLSLVNLATLLGRKDIYEPGRREYLGPDSFVAHWVRSQAAYERVEADFDTAQRVRSASGNTLRCAPWAESFPPLREHFPCCVQNWTLCEPATPLLRPRQSDGVNLAPPTESRIE